VTIASVVVSAVLRGFAAALAGLFLVCGLALLDWAITPATGSNAGGLLHGSVVVFAAGHFLPVTVDGSALTIRPLLLALIAVLMVASSASRGRAVRGRTTEAMHGLILALAYAAAVEAVAHYLAPADNVRLTAAPFWIAAVGVILGLATHRTAWNRWWRRTAPAFLAAGVRAGSGAVCLLLGAGGLALAAGLMRSFHAAVKISELVAPSTGAGFGLTLLSLAFLPNAAIAGLGFVTGAGFTIGAGSYSPFGSVPVELPAIPLLAAVPDGAASSRLGMLVLAVPVLIAAVVAWQVDRRLDLRWQRMAAAGTAAVFAGLVVAGLAAVAAGGVAGGPWSSMGVPPLLAGGAVAGVLGTVSLAWTGVAGLRTVPWRAPRAFVAIDALDADEDEAAGGQAGEQAAEPEAADHATTADEADPASQTADEADPDPAEETDPDLAEESDGAEAADDADGVRIAGDADHDGTDSADSADDMGADAVADPVPDAEQEFPGAAARDRRAASGDDVGAADAAASDADEMDGHQRAG
jgi:hypothetical protein